MLRTYLKSSLGPLTVTEAVPGGAPGVRLDSELLAAARIMPGERVLVVRLATGAEFTTYASPARRGTGAVIVDGGEALGLTVGELLEIRTECVLVDREALAHEPRRIDVDGQNRAVAQPE